MPGQLESSGFWRIALDSIPARWAAAALGAHAGLTVTGIVWAIIHETGNAEHGSAHEVYQAVGLGVVMAFGISSATVITIAEVIDTIMVIAHFIGRRMKSEGRAEGRAEAEAAMYSRMSEWLDRLLESHPELKGTLEPLPAPEGLNGKERVKPQEEH